MITGHLIDAHSIDTGNRWMLAGNAVRLAAHTACTASTCADPRSARR
jgi:hypothetical protein